MTVYRHAPENGGMGIHVEDFGFWYGDFHALSGVTMDVAPNKITAFIGPSGCGKSTFLRCMNRMNDLIEGTHTAGVMSLDGADIYAEGVDPVDLRRRVGMIFQQPNPFPKSIYENVAFGPRLLGVTSKGDLDDIVEESLKRSNLWKEVADQLDKNGLARSSSTSTQTSTFSSTRRSMPLRRATGRRPRPSRRRRDGSMTVAPRSSRRPSCSSPRSSPSRVTFASSSS